MDNNQSGTKQPESQLVAEREHISSQPTISHKKIKDKPAEINNPQRHWLMGSIVFLSFIFSIGALAGAAYLYILNIKQTELVSQQISKQQQQVLAQINRQQSIINTKLDEPLSNIARVEFQQKQINNTLSTLKNLPNQQALLNERVATLARRNPTHWMIAEADYLVKMAGRKLWVEQDPATALVLLKDADNRIAAIKDPQLLPLRKALSHDIADVAAIKVADISGAIFQLDEIIKQLPKLPLNYANSPQQKQAVSNNEVTHSIGDWRANLHKTWQALINDFISIRHRTTDISPLLEPKQEWYLVENISNKLLQAQLALYRQDQANYLQSIKMANAWINQYFDLESSQVIQVQKQLAKLMRLNITPIAVTQLDSTSLLQQLTNFGELVAPVNKDQTL